MRSLIVLLCSFLLAASAVAQHVPAPLSARVDLFRIFAEATSDTGSVTVEDKQIFWSLAPEGLKRELSDPARREDLVFRIGNHDRELFASLRLSIENGVATFTPGYEAARLASDAAGQELVWYIAGEPADELFPRQRAEELVQAAANRQPVDFFSQGRLVLTLPVIQRAETWHSQWTERLLFLLTP